ncbi:MAG TPA: hypothetical protein VJ729_02135 [Nitrososphaeraceae archaeon]|nr:hypothetical protein [Nitrososphaeraceae archaeon]
MQELPFREILKLIEYIPITGDLPSNGKFINGITMDSPFYLKHVDYLASFRDIVRVVNMKFMKSEIWETFTAHNRHKQLNDIGCSYPVEYLLFDFCLAALEGDYLNAKLYLSHSFHILGLHQSFNLLLSVILNERLAYDNDVRELLTLLAKISEPRNAKTYLRTYGYEYERRYQNYLYELEQLRLMSA